MQTLFNHLSPINYGVVRYAEWNYIRNGLLKNLETVQDYYRSRVFTVKSNHFLCRLINSINVPHSLELERFYDNADSKADVFSMAMRMTSPIYKGAIFNGGFYGSNNPEILISDNSSFDPLEVHKNWRTVSAVKPIMHPRSDLDMLLPNGRDTGSETGLAIVCINIPMLVVQYRAFVLDQLYKQVAVEDSMLTVAHFVHMYVLPNMLPAQLDLAIYNRINNLSKGAPLGESKRKHPFALSNFTPKVDNVLAQILRDMKNRNLEYEMILRTVPMVSDDNLEVTMLLPDIAPTRQVIWAELLARIDTIDLMTRLGGKESIGKNRATINYFTKFFRNLEGDKTLESHLPYGMYLDIKYQIKEILERVN